MIADPALAPALSGPMAVTRLSLAESEGTAWCREWLVQALASV